MAFSQQKSSLTLRLTFRYCDFPALPDWPAASPAPWWPARPSSTCRLSFWGPRQQYLFIFSLQSSSSLASFHHLVKSGKGRSLSMTLNVFNFVATCPKSCKSATLRLRDLRECQFLQICVKRSCFAAAFNTAAYRLHFCMIFFFCGRNSNFKVNLKLDLEIIKLRFGEQLPLHKKIIYRTKGVSYVLRGRKI